MGPNFNFGPVGYIQGPYGGRRPTNWESGGEAPRKGTLGPYRPLLAVEVQHSQNNALYQYHSSKSIEETSIVQRSQGQSASLKGNLAATRPFDCKMLARARLRFRATETDRSHARTSRREQSLIKGPDFANFGDLGILDNF